MGGEISATDNAILLAQKLWVCRQNALYMHAFAHASSTWARPRILIHVFNMILGLLRLAADL